MSVIPPGLVLNGLVRRCWLSRHALRIDTARDSLRGLLIWKAAQKKNGRRERQVLKTKDSWWVSGGGGGGGDEDHTNLSHPPWRGKKMKKCLGQYEPSFIFKNTLKHNKIYCRDTCSYFWLLISIHWKNNYFCSALFGLLVLRRIFYSVGWFIFAYFILYCIMCSGEK